MMRGFIISLIFVALVHGNDGKPADESARIGEILKNYLPPHGNHSKRLAGGIPTTPGEYPWMVSLFYKDEFICGGVIYDKRTIITAANCVQQRKKDYFIRVGDYRLYKKDLREQKRSIRKIISHPKYRFFRRTNNVAILKLDKALYMYDYVQKIDIPELWKDIKLQDLDDCAITGWGWKSEDITQNTWVLNVVSALIFEREQCRQFLDTKNVELKNSQVCTFNDVDGSGPCVNDNGAPLVCWDKSDNPYLLGLVSFIPLPCDEFNGLSVNTRMSIFKDWIEENA